MGVVVPVLQTICSPEFIPPATGNHILMLPKPISMLKLVSQLGNETSETNFKAKMLKIKWPFSLLAALIACGVTWVVFSGCSLRGFWLKLKFPHGHLTPEGGASAGTITIKSIYNEIFR